MTQQDYDTAGLCPEMPWKSSHSPPKTYGHVVFENVSKSSKPEVFTQHKHRLRQRGLQPSLKRVWFPLKSGELPSSRLTQEKARVLAFCCYKMTFYSYLLVPVIVGSENFTEQLFCFLVFSEELMIF